MTTARMLPNGTHFKEFQNDPVTGHHYTATCGETAMASAMVSASAPIESTQDAIALMTAMTREMMALGWADSPNGATTVSHLKDEATRRGYAYDAADYIAFDLGLSHADLQALLTREAGLRPVVVEVSKAYNLREADGAHDESGVLYHYICVLGVDANGDFICQDGDNSDIVNSYAVYTWATIASAGPCGVLILDMQEASLDISQVGSFYVQQADGSWKCKQTGFAISGSMLDTYKSMPALGSLNGMTALGLPISDKKYNGSVGYQDFERGVLVYDPGRADDSPVGAVGQCYVGHIDSGYGAGMVTAPAVAAANAALAQAKADLKTAQDRQAQLTSEVNDLNAKVEADDAAVATANAAVDAAGTRVSTLQAEVDDLQAQLTAARNAPAAHDPLGDAVRAIIAEAKKEGSL